MCSMIRNLSCKLAAKFRAKLLLKVLQGVLKILVSEKLGEPRTTARVRSQDTDWCNPWIVLNKVFIFCWHQNKVHCATPCKVYKTWEIKFITSFYYHAPVCFVPLALKKHSYRKKITIKKISQAHQPGVIIWHQTMHYFCGEIPQNYHLCCFFDSPQKNGSYLSLMVKFRPQDTKLQPLESSPLPHQYLVDQWSSRHQAFVPTRVRKL